MSSDAPLKPVFVPPLATLFAHAEQEKGAPLTEAEMLRIRDRGVCIMMRAEQAQHMDDARGYRDVNPENCLADWHRLRTQVSGRGYLPKLILCLPGDDQFRARSEPLLKQAEIEYEFRARDPRMAASFEASKCRIRNTLSREDLEAIDGHSTVLYVLSKNYTPQEASSVAFQFLLLGRHLVDAGAIAVKSESSGLAYTGSVWRQFADCAEAAVGTEAEVTIDYWPTLFQGYVQFPIQSQTDLYTCGMHLLGQPDLILSNALANELFADEWPSELISLFSSFGHYVLAECKEGFTAGHTFRKDEQSRRHRVVWEPCEGYDEDEFFFNPYGRWRFERVGER